MHRSVMVKEVVEGLNVRAEGTYIDGTAGHGGHALAVLAASEGRARVLLIDQDEEALEVARRRLGDWSGRCVFAQANFADMAAVAAERGFGPADGVLLDLGVSSAQLEAPDRGFSFMHDGPLDMRMDRRSPRTAEAIVNGSDEHELERIFREWGDEPEARGLARAIVRERALRPIRTTGQLADVVVRARRRGRYGKIHPATQVFQALRMAVNAEADSLERGLAAGVGLLREAGRMAVISFHSGEDRAVKTFFRRHEGRWVALAQGGRRWLCERPEVRRVNRKPIGPADEEIRLNPRSRSAKLRIVERVAAGPAPRDEKPSLETA